MLLPPNDQPSANAAAFSVSWRSVLNGRENGLPLTRTRASARNSPRGRLAPGTLMLTRPTRVNLSVAS